MSFKNRLCLIFLGTLFIAGCGGSSSSGSSQDETTSGDATTTLDADAQPITSGNWYQPSLSTSWQWQLLGSLNDQYPVEIYDIDLFDTAAETIAALQSTGKKVICYFSAGSYENFREDKDEFDTSVLGNTLDGWEDENWLDIRAENVHNIMLNRLDLAQQKGCDGVEPDNMDGYLNESGFDLSYDDQLAYNRFIANEAHNRDLAVGLKNDLEQIDDLVTYYDFAVNEQCFEYNECDTLQPFIDYGKPVLNAEYLQQYADNETARNQLCAEANQMQFSTLVLPLDLDDSFRYSCSD